MEQTTDLLPNDDAVMPSFHATIIILSNRNRQSLPHTKNRFSTCVTAWRIDPSWFTRAVTQVAQFMSCKADGAPLEGVDASFSSTHQYHVSCMQT